jgi:hypothetical protein
MSQFVIPQSTIEQFDQRGETELRDYYQAQVSRLGLNNPKILAFQGYMDDRFGVQFTPSERPEIDQFGFYQLNDSQRFEAADSLATGSFIQDIESQLEQRIPRTVPNTQRMMYPTFGYTPQADMQNPQFTEARLGAIREGFTDRLARALNENPQNIDIDGGLDRPVQRALLSFQQEPQEKLSFLQKEFGRENVKQFEYNEKPNFLIKQDGRQVLVDELGFAFGDILDMTRGAVTMTGEIAGGFAGPYTKLPLIRKGATVVKGAMGAGAGKTATEYLSEGIESGVNPEADFQSVAPIGRGLATTAIDYPMGKGFQFLGRALFNKRVPGANQQMDDVIQAADRLMQRFSDEGIDIPLSPSMRMSRGAAQLEQETIEQTARAGVSAPEQSGVARLRLELADNMQRLLDILQTGQGNMDEIIEASVKNFDDMASAAAASGKKEVLGAANVLEKHFKNLSDNVLETANRRDNVQIGEDLGNTVRNIFESSKSRVDDAYDAAKIAGQNIPSRDMLGVAQQLINSIDSLDIPTGATNRIIRSFVPRKVLLQLSKSADLKANAKARLKQIAEYEDAIKGMEGDQMTMFPLFDETAPVSPGDPLTLSFQQIVDFKKNIGKLYGATSRDQFLDRKGLGGMIDSLDGILDDMAEGANSEAYDLLQEANQMWLRERKPILDDNQLGKIAQGGQIDEIRTAGVLLDQGVNTVNRLKNLRNALPDESSKLQFDKEIREAAVERLFYLAEDANSLINVSKLSKALSENQIFNKKSGFFDDKMIESLKRMGRFSQQRKDILGLSAAPTIPLESVKRVLLDTDLPVQEKRILLAQITDQMRLSNRMDSIRANQARQNIAQGGGDFADNANSTMEAILGLPNSGAVKEVFDTLDEPMKNQIRAKIRAHIFAGASTGGGGTRTSTNLGEVQLPDPNSQIMQDLLNTESKQYEVVKEILGSEGVKDIVDVVKILDRMGGNYIDEGSSLLSGNQVQAIGRGGNRRTFVPRVIIGFDMGVPIYKMLGFALSNDKFVRAINSGQADSAINNLLPFVFGSDIALEAYLEESTGDPRLFKAIPRLIGSPDRGVNDSLVN